MLRNVDALGDQTHTNPTPIPWISGILLGTLSRACSTSLGVTKSPATGGSQGTISTQLHMRTCSAFLLSFLRNTATVAGAYGKGGPGSARGEAAIVFWWCWGGTVAMGLQGRAGGVVGMFVFV